MRAGLTAPANRSVWDGGLGLNDHETAGWLARLRGWLTHSQARLIDKAAATTVPASAGLGDIQHVVILMQENSITTSARCRRCGGSLTRPC